MEAKRTLITDTNFDYLGDELANNNSLIQKGDIDFLNFPDKWPKQFIRKIKETIEYKEVTYIGDFSQKDLFVDHYCIMRAILHYKAKKLRVIMPFFPGQMDRKVKEGDVVTAKYMADLLNTLPSGKRGKTSIHTFDIHSLQEEFFFDDNKINLEVHSLLHTIKKKIDNTYTIAFPDKGAYDRFGGYFEGFDQVICSKKREGDNRDVKVEAGKIKNRKIITIDDIAQSGNTTVKAAQTFREQGAKSVDAYITHGVFPGNSQKYLSENVDNIYVTDSIPGNKEKAEDIPNMHVLSIGPSVEAKIMLD